MEVWDTFVPYLEVSLHPAYDETRPHCSYPLIFPQFFFAVLLFCQGEMEIVIDAIWRRCITEQGFVFHYFRTKSRRLEHSHHLNV